MICPNCGARLADGTSMCPVCGKDLGVTNKIPKLQGTWCTSCGALVPYGETQCPKCGMPASSTPVARPVRDLRLPKISDADKTAEFSAIEAPDAYESTVVQAESALPPERTSNDDVSLGYDRMAHVRVMAIAAIAALIVMGGLIIFITHPFDPGKYDQRAKDAADTSTAGSPGQLESLSGQDTGSSNATYDAALATFDLIEGAYADLSDLAKRLDEQEAYFLEHYLLEDYDARQQGLDAAELLAIDSVEQLDASSSYAEDIEHISQLGNWLRNRCDILVDAWEVDLGYLAPSMVRDTIDSVYFSDKDDEGVSIYKTYFEQNYASWAPEKR